MRIAILGTRGIPAQHGGFETFAEELALYLIGCGWEVTVYCQEDGGGPVTHDRWFGVSRVKIPVSVAGPAGTVLFDFKSITHAARSEYTGVLTLGYNTAILCVLLRIFGPKNVINMDGIEWHRPKWSALARVWLLVNERAACVVGNHLIADHPEVAKHLSCRVSDHKITVIPYGAHDVSCADASLLVDFGLEPYGFATVIARPEPENSILEIVTAFSRRYRGIKLVVLGDYPESAGGYRGSVRARAGSEVIFLGAIYDRGVLGALRFFSRLYIHGHTVGGTNPSLVEALGAGSPVLAHDNRFNRWVAGEGARFFGGEDECAHVLDQVLGDDAMLDVMRLASKQRFKERFRWEIILGRYERLMRDVFAG